MKEMPLSTDNMLDWRHEYTPCNCSRCDWLWRSVAQVQDCSAALTSAMWAEAADAENPKDAAQWLRQAIASYDDLRAQWTEEGVGPGWAEGDARRQEAMEWFRAVLDA